MKNVFFVLLLFAYQYALGQTTNPSPYCDASFDDQNGMPVDDHINSVQFGTLHYVTNAQCPAPHYVFYNNLSIPNFIRGNSYTLTVNFRTVGGCGYGVWIDYNHNNIFEATEKISGTSGNTYLSIFDTPTITESITIPLTAVTGNTRLRVRVVEDDIEHAVSTNESPCNASTSATDVMDWGETEDYTINITSTSGINDMNEVNNLLIYPNPVVNTLTLNESLIGSFTYKIISAFGQEIQSGTLNNNMEKQMIVVSELSEGIYFLQLFENNRSFGQQKFIKMNK